MARPTRYDADRRRREFVAWLLNGRQPDHAARLAQIDPWRALRIVSEPEMLDLLVELHPGRWEALREVLRERAEARMEAGHGV